MKQWLLGALMLASGLAASARGNYFVVRVRDEATGRGVPLVELRTVNDVRYFTDSNGVAAIDEPGLDGQSVYFHVRSPGYEVAADGFGLRGARLDFQAGGTAEVRVRRLNLAERLYRITGGGIYRDSVLAGLPVPVKQPLLNGRAFGSDSVVNALYRGRLFWFWGDTNLPGYPLGNFQTTGATSALPSAGGLDPAQGVDLEYFVDAKGGVRGMAPVPGDGPTWIGGVTVLRDAKGEQQLFAGYVKIRNLLEAYERGLLRYNDEKSVFEPIARFAPDVPLYPQGHPFHRIEVKGDSNPEYVYFADPFPLVRVRATPADYSDLSRYEAFTCLKSGSRLARPEIDRDPEGRVRYAWRKDAPPVDGPEQEQLEKKGLLKPAESLLQLRDVESGQRVVGHRGSIDWNPYRKRWVMITVELGGTSHLGEVWYAEADQPLGPWVYARKILTHPNYSFYNPKQHPYFHQDGGRLLYFEGTYTNSFSGNPEPTPRYEYNQIMHRLDLADTRLVLPVPFYPHPKAALPFLRSGGRRGAPSVAPAFFALERTRPGAVPVFVQASTLTLTAGAKEEPPLFYALPPEQKEPPASTTLLYEYAGPPGADAYYAPEDATPRPGYHRTERPLCRVWKTPWPGRSPLP